MAPVRGALAPLIHLTPLQSSPCVDLIIQTGSGNILRRKSRCQHKRPPEGSTCLRLDSDLWILNLAPFSKPWIWQEIQLDTLASWRRGKRTFCWGRNWTRVDGFRAHFRLLSLCIINELLRKVWGCCRAVAGASIPRIALEKSKKRNLSRFLLVFTCYPEDLRRVCGLFR